MDQKRLKQELSNKIISLRLKKGWRSVDLAHELKIDRQNMFRYENGERNPSFLTLCKIAEALDVNISVLTSGIGTN